jgi:hypothetical protein
MLAYLFWHRPYSTTTTKQYEEALLRFQQHLRQQDPPGFRGSASFRVAALPWLGNRAGYEDWCLLDGSWALDPLNSFAVAGPVTSAHDADGPDGRRVWWTLRFGLGRTCYAGAIDRNLADAATRHSVAPGPRYCASAIPANDIMAAPDGARSRQGVWPHRAAGRRDRRTIRLVRAGHRAGARRCILTLLEGASASYCSSITGADKTA